MSYRAKFDASHVPITQALKRLGWPFVDCARYPGLGCDILSRHVNGYPIFLELKTPGPPSSLKLTESEQSLRDLFPQFWRMVTNLEHALEALGLAVGPVK